MVGGKMAGITDSISPNNPSIRAEKIFRPRLDYLPLAFVMLSRGPLTPAGRLEVAILILVLVVIIVVIIVGLACVVIIFGLGCVVLLSLLAWVLFVGTMLSSFCP